MAIELKPLAPRDAMAALEARGVKVPSFHWQEIYAGAHASQFTVAKSAGFDILGDIYEALQQALAEGKTYRQFADELTPLLQAKGWWGRQPLIDPQTGQPIIAELGSPRRLQLIFDANMRVSYAAGHWSSFERNKAARPFLRYVHLQGQEHPRLHHEALHNIVLPVDHPFWDTHAAPNGWNCHCTLQSLSQRDIDRLLAQGEKLRFEPPTIEYRMWTNKITGEERAVPIDIDPGWDHNPGRTGAAAAANNAYAQKLAAGDPDLSLAAFEEHLKSEAFDRFLSDPQGKLPVMAVPKEIGDAIGLKAGRVVLLSDETMRKQLANHPDLTTADYRALADLGRSPTLIVRDGDTTVILLKEAGDRWRYSVVKATVSGKAAFLTSYRYARQSTVTRLLHKPGARILIDKR